MTVSVDASGASIQGGATATPLRADGNNNNAQPTKTVFLIRHAESLENERLACAKAVLNSIQCLRWPAYRDLQSASGLLNIANNVDSPLSERGRQQVTYMSNVLRQSDFLRTYDVQSVAHSPLIRAKETSMGMLGCLAPDHKSETVQQVLELDLLTEKTPAEWIPGNYVTFQRRMRALEDWVADQPHSVIALVGHSQFFKALLQLDYKFGNCDVMRVTFHPREKNCGIDQDESGTNTKTEVWTDLTEIHLCQLPDPVETENE